MTYERDWEDDGVARPRAIRRPPLIARPAVGNPRENPREKPRKRKTKADAEWVGESEPYSVWAAVPGRQWHPPPAPDPE